MNKKDLFASALILVFLAGSPTAVRKAQAASSQLHTMQFDGRTRRYILHVPPTYDAAKSVALVMVLHGGTQSPESAESMSRMSELADQNGFIAFYPSGTGRNQDELPTWNSGNCCSYAYWAAS
jgi:polyhydroxybutyrate depolymerase